MNIDSFKVQPIQKFLKYKHISFDLWLTLIKSDPAFKVRRNALFKTFFAIDKPIDEIAAVIRKFDVLTNSINEKVTRNFHTSEIYYLILDNLSVNIEQVNCLQLEEFYLQSEQLLMQHKPILLDPELPEFLKTLQNNGITMNILSNTAFIKGISLRKILAHYGLEGFFSFQAYSDETGFSKPGMEMYQYAYDKINQNGKIEKKEVLHVGDNIVSDFNGALKFGFDAHLIINKTKDEPKLQPL